MERRLTKQRQLIYDITMTLFHPSAEEVYEKVHRIYPKIGRATVYRNLNILSESGFLTKLFFTSEATRYDTNVKCHNHFYCEKCGKVIDLKNTEKINLPKNLYVKSLSITFYGLCSECLKNKGD